MGRLNKCILNCSQYSLVAAVQALSPVYLFVTPWTAACQAPLSFTVSKSLFRFMSISSVMLYNHLNLCWPLLLFPSTFSSIKVFSNKSALPIRWSEFWNFSISPSKEYSGLISCRIDWFNLFAVQGTLKSLLQHCIQLFKLVISYSLDKYPEVGLLDYMVVLSLVFWGISILNL